MLQVTTDVTVSDIRGICIAVTVPYASLFFWFLPSWFVQLGRPYW